MAKASGPTPDQSAILARNGNKNGWKRLRRRPVVRLAEERHPPPRDDAAQREIRKGNLGDGLQEDPLLRVGDEILAIMEARRHIAVEEAWRQLP